MRRWLTLGSILMALGGCGSPAAPSMAGDAGVLPMETADGGVVLPADDDAGALEPDAGPPVPTVTLSLRDEGWGFGTVRALGHGTCDADCELEVPEGATIVLEAEPGRGQAHGAWSGDCEAAGESTTCTLTMDVARAVGFYFTGGRHLDAVVFGGENTQSVDDVALAPDGDIVVCGFFNLRLTRPDGEVEVAYGGRDGFVARLSPDGRTLRWLQRTSGTGAEFANAIAVDDAGEVFVVGPSIGQAVIGEHVVEESTGTWAARLAVDGSVVWARALPISAGATFGAQASVVGADGSLYVAGTEYLGGTLRAAVVRMARADGEGSVITFGGSGVQSAVSIARGPGTDLYVGGRFEGQLAGASSVGGSLDGFVLRMNALGAVAWRRRIGGSGTDRVRAIAADAGGRLYVIGAFADSVVLPGRDTATTATGDDDWFITALDPLGDALWTRSGGGAGAVAATEIAVGPGGTDLYVAGSSSGAGAANPATTTSGEHVGWVARLDAAPGGSSFVRTYAASVGIEPRGLVVGAESVVVVGSFEGEAMLAPEGDPITSASGDGMLLLVGR